MKIVIKNGKIVDPSAGIEKEMDLLIEDDKILAVAPDINTGEGTGLIDASGCIVLPGLIDMHVHFREPGREDVETIIGGSQVAAAGGFTSVCTMPNTSPVIDNQALVRFIKLQAEKGPVNVYPVAAVSKGCLGGEITEMGELIEAGAIGFSDDGVPVSSSILMRRALEYSRMFNVPLMSHAEDLALTDGGIMNEGRNSILLGLPGIPAESEEVMISRDILLAGLTGGRVHFCHVSTAGAVEIIKIGKARGINITCETAPHYFSLTDDAVFEKMSLAKMKPPLRTEEDRLAIIEGLSDGTIDVIATDHAPHSLNEKMQEMQYAPFGIIGLETAVPLVISVLVKQHGFSYSRAFSKMTSIPAGIIGINAGTLKPGAPADITVINPDKKIKVDEKFIRSKSKNTPFMGRELYGSVEYTIRSGDIVYSAG